MLAGLAAAGLAGLRWLRVAQREHYLAGSVTRFAVRWWALGANRLLLVAGLLGVLLAERAPLAGVVGSVAVATGPFGLALRGRTAPLAWTRRLRTLAAIWVVLQVAMVGFGASLGLAAPVAVLAAVAVPLLIDAALAIGAPLENRLAVPYVRRASARLHEVGPTIVGITGSYGKTSTKAYVTHLVAATKQVVPTPRSFNNRAGLARAVNEQLADGTEVFVAEMGTYGPGEIADLVEWCPPSIAVITAIGPVHLERMRSEERIVEAKSEIVARAHTAVLNVDDRWLGPLADRLASAGTTVRRCSAVDRRADVAVIRDAVLVGGSAIGRLPEGGAAAPTNVACAVAVALDLGVPRAAVAERLLGLPTPENRLVVSSASGGFTILDDTYNSNPAGAQAALRRLGRLARPGGRRVVVTPGMVELGVRQAAENGYFAALAAARVTHLVVVGHTNRPALVAGARAAGGAEVVTVETRPQAAEWVRSHLHEGDVVLYENDLPDHFP